MGSHRHGGIVVIVAQLVAVVVPEPRQAVAHVGEDLVALQGRTNGGLALAVDAAAAVAGRGAAYRCGWEIAMRGSMSWREGRTWSARLLLVKMEKPEACAGAGGPPASSSLMSSSLLIVVKRCPVRRGNFAGAFFAIPCLIVVVVTSHH